MSSSDTSHTGEFGSRFLAGLDDEDIATVLRYTEARRYSSGELAIRCGDVDRSVYVIAAGSFEVVAPTPNGPRRVAVMRVGEIFGDLAFLDGEPRSADVRAAEDSEAFIMTPASFDRLRLAHPRLALSFVLDLGRILSGRFRESSRLLAARSGP
jgi:CRP/FNR family transcriptional regulator, cyclic AMP receptor protein